MDLEMKKKREFEKRTLGTYLICKIALLIYEESYEEKTVQSHQSEMFSVLPIKYSMYVIFPCSTLTQSDPWCDHLRI